MARLVRLGDIAAVTQGLGTSGRAAGARSGDWSVRCVSVGDIQDDGLNLPGVPRVGIERNSRTERYRLRPGDVLVTARSSRFKAALVPADVEETVADASLSIIRPADPVLGPYLWWFMTSKRGRSQMEELMVGATVLALPPSAIAEIELPVPNEQTLMRIAELVDASERAYAAAVEAAELRRTVFRDALLENLLHEAQTAGETPCR